MTTSTELKRSIEKSFAKIESLLGYMDDIKNSACITDVHKTRIINLLRENAVEVKQNFISDINDQCSKVINNI